MMRKIGGMVLNGVGINPLNCVRYAQMESLMPWCR
jgi:hypothetical protein